MKSSFFLYKSLTLCVYPFYLDVFTYPLFPNNIRHVIFSVLATVFNVHLYDDVTLLF